MRPLRRSYFSVFWSATIEAIEKHLQSEWNRNLWGYSAGVPPQHGCVIHSSWRRTHGSFRVPTQSLNKSGSRDRYWLVSQVMFSAEINRGSGEISGQSVRQSLEPPQSAVTHILYWFGSYGWNRVGEEREFLLLWCLTNIAENNNLLQKGKTNKKHLVNDFIHLIINKKWQWAAWLHCAGYNRVGWFRG